MTRGANTNAIFARLGAAIRAATRMPAKAGIGTILACCAIAFASPASAQLYSDGYKFLKAVEDKDGTEATKMIEEPGSTIINSRDITTGRTALHIVVDRRDATWLSFLLGKGANPNIASKSGDFPLTSAIQLNFVEGVQLLLDGGARVDVANSAGETPLISAVHARNTALMRVLLEAGADPDRYDNSGRSARDYARLSVDGASLLSAIERAQRPAAERAGNNGTYGPSF